MTAMRAGAVVLSAVLALGNACEPQAGGSTTYEVVLHAVHHRDEQTPNQVDPPADAEWSIGAEHGAEHIPSLGTLAGWRKTVKYTTTDRGFPVKLTITAPGRTTCEVTVVRLRSTVHRNGTGKVTCET